MPELIKKTLMLDVGTWESLEELYGSDMPVSMAVRKILLSHIKLKRQQRAALAPEVGVEDV